MFNKRLPKIVLFVTQWGKLWQGRTGYGWQRNMAHALCVLDK
jgi:hypothetical protein